MKRYSILAMSLVLFCSMVLPCLALPLPYCTKTLYLDGQLVADVNINMFLMFNETILVGAEGSPANLYNEFVGTLDEFAVYEGILSEARILEHYNARGGGYIAYSSEVVEDSPLLWLKFEDASVTNDSTAVNSGSSTTDGTYTTTGGAEMSQVTGICGGADLALNMPGAVDYAGGHTVAINDNGEFGSDLYGNGVTVEVWVKFTNVNPGDDSDWARFFSHGDYGYTVMVAAPNMLGVYGAGEENYFDLPYDINDGQWHHVVATYLFGSRDSLDPHNYVEQVAFDNPVLWLRFEDQDPCDSSGNNYWVDYGSAASIASKVGSIGNCVKLDGTSGQDVFGVAAANNSFGPPDPDDPVPLYDDYYAFAPSDITFEMWYKTLPPDQPQPESYAFFFQQAGSYLNEYRAPAVGIASNQIRVFGGNAAGYTSVNPEFDEKWHHLVVTYDENYNDVTDNMMATVYLDGTWKYEHLFTGEGAHLGPELSHILVGAGGDIWQTYSAFAGFVDEFAIYDGILEPYRIEAHYYAWQPDSCQEVIERGLAPDLARVDINSDCVVDFYDFASFAEQWLICVDPERIGIDENCVATW